MTRRTTALFLVGLGLGCGSAPVLEANGIGRSAVTVGLETVLAVIGGAECRAMQVFGARWNKDRPAATYVPRGFQVELSSPDGVITEACAPNSPRITGPIELPSPRLFQNAFGRTDVEARLSHRRFGFTPCRSGADVTVIATGPSTLPEPSQSFHLTVPVAAECCSPGLSFCGGACVDTNTNAAHCGGCGQTCGGGCSAGMCAPCGGELFTCRSQSGPPRTSCCQNASECVPEDGTCRGGL